MRTTSASFRAVLRALAVLEGWESGTTPFPIGVGRKGRWVRSIRSLMASSAWAYAAPLPTTTRGALADLSIWAILKSLASSAAPFGPSGTGYISGTSAASSTAP